MAVCAPASPFPEKCLQGLYSRRRRGCPRSWSPNWNRVTSRGLPLEVEGGCLLFLTCTVRFDPAKALELVTKVWMWAGKYSPVS